MVQMQGAKCAFWGNHTHHWSTACIVNHCIHWMGPYTSIHTKGEV